MSNVTRFTLNADHIKLAKSMFVGWQHYETGAPEIDPKRPYGNSDVERDVCKLLGWRPVIINEEDEYTDEQRKRAACVHREMEIALQIMLCCYPAQVGLYEIEDEYNSTTWKYQP